MRRFFTPGWLGLHLLAIVLIGLFLLAGYWQVLRGQEGNLQSWAYAIEWPLFAIFVVVMWVRMIRDELRGEEPEESMEGEGQPSAPAPPAESVQFDDEEDAELAAYNRHLARLNDEAAHR